MYGNWVNFLLKFLLLFFSEFIRPQFLNLALSFATLCTLINAASPY